MASVESLVAPLSLEEKNILQWHPRFNHYQLANKDILLLSASEQLLLPKAEFPLLSYIDGRASTTDILSQTIHEEPAHQAQFLFHVESLSKQGILTATDEMLEYVKADFKTQAECVKYEKNSLRMTLVSLSVHSAKEIERVDLFGIFQLAHTQIKKGRVAAHNELKLIVVDDFLDPRIQLTLTHNPCLVIKISGEQLWLSPLLFEHSAPFFDFLQTRILNNQPARKWISQQRPDVVHSYPFTHTLTFSDERRDILASILANQLANSLPTLASYDKVSQRVLYHPIYYDTKKDASSGVERFTPVHLTHCISHFDFDGGSRTQAAADTVDRLMLLVSPITGVINHLGKVPGTEDKLISSFRSGFFKILHANTIDVNSFTQTCMGKGVTEAQSKASALSEAIERYCALYRHTLPTTLSSHSALIQSAKRAVAFQVLSPYSDRQYQGFSQNVDESKQHAERYDDQQINWLPTWSLTHQQEVYVPAVCCFRHTPYPEARFGSWHSNGCAAGNTLEEAILQGLFELIERDAVAIWWYNRCVYPEFDMARLGEETIRKFQQSICPDNELSGYHMWVLDLTHDIGVPVMAAIGQRLDTGQFIMGFGCHLKPELAAQRALTELCQLEAIREQNSAPFNFDQIEPLPFLYPAKGMDASAETLAYHPDIKQNILAIVDRLKSIGLETLVLDYSQAHIPLFTAKVFVPGLCHIWPQLANNRLYKLPVKLGLKEKAHSESELNPQALFI